MKKLSIEEKSKRYDEAIERVDNIKTGKCETTFMFTEGLFEYVFPELRESEDERIRKALKEYFINSFQNNGVAAICGVHIKDILAWFEKQGKKKSEEEVDNLHNYLYGEQKPVVIIPKFRVGDEIKTSNEESLTITKIDEKGYWSEDLFICGFNDADKWELVEQKLADKVEPKFKVGDIVKYKKNPYLTYILKRFTDDGDYEFHAIGKDGNEGGTCFADVEYQDEWELVKQKTGWSEDDERTYKSIIYYFAHNYPLTVYQQEFVKFLKDRYTWKPSDEQNIYKNGVYQEADGVRIWHNGHTFLVPKDWNKGKWPLLNKKGEENSKQNKEHLMNEIDALLDWDFVAATKHIQDLGTDIPLKDGEYLITAPVWMAMYEHRIALNKALSNIGAMEIDFSEDFWFAQRYNVLHAWYFGGTNRNLCTYNVYNAYQVGAVTL